MVIKVYNTMSRKLEEFEPLEKGKVKMFVCGPTVYDLSHIGHAKTYVAFDVIAKYLRYRGYEVEYVQNITDIDDKIIKRGNERKIDPLKLSDDYYKEYLKDMASLSVTSVDKYAKASDYIPQIIGQVQGLIDNGYAYESGGSVYYSITKFEEYGKLSHRTFDEMVSMSRIENDPYKKEEADFVLWKASKPNEPSWESPWGKGRPGWHIEDTAITINELGEQYDLHGGGEDLIFPHHEAEIAQAEAFTGVKPFVKYWLHSAFLKISKEKMSKSLGNMINIREAVEKHGGENVRFMFAVNPYYRPIEFDEKHVQEAKEQLQKIKNTFDNLIFLSGKTGKGGEKINVGEYRKKFTEAMDNNFNTADGISIVFELVRHANRLVTENSLKDKENIAEITDFLDEAAGIFGFSLTKKTATAPAEIMKLVEEREKARASKNFRKSDELRDEIKKLGWLVSDTPEGPKVEKL